MKKKMKGLLSVGLCLAVGLSVGSLVACQPSNEPEKETPGLVSEYYLVGNFSDESLPQAAAWGDQHCATVDDVPEAVSFKTTETKGVYEVTVNLYEDDMFQVLTVGQGWNGQMGYKTFKASLDEDETGNFQVHDSFPVDDIQIVNSGKYKLTLTLQDETKALALERTGDAPALPVKVSGVTLDQTTLTKTVGDEDVTLVATVTPDDAADKTVTWTTSDAAVATVTTAGKVSFVGAGEATITATASGKTATCVVTVVAAGTQIVDVESVSIPETLTAHVGAVTIEATVLPENATNKTVTYSSSDNTVVKVEGGVIKALKAGTATITATAGEQTDTCEVTVVADYCLVGSSASPAFGGTSWKTDYDGVADVPTGILFTQDADDATKYTLDIDLYVGSGVKIINVGVGAGWDDLTLNLGAASGTNLVNTATTATEITTGTQNIGVTDDGNYRLTLTVPETGAPTLSYQYLGEAAELGLKLDIRIKGGYNTDWSPTDLCYEGLNPDQLTTGTFTATFTVKYVGSTAADFGIYTTVSGADSQLNWGRDDVSVDLTDVTGITDGEYNWSITAGVYKFTVKVDPTGTFTDITIESGATEDENTVVIGTPATPAE